MQTYLPIWPRADINLTSSAQPNEETPVRLTKRNLFKTAAIGSAFVGALAVAAPASANTFGPTYDGTFGDATLSYDDANDEFCVNGIYNGTKFTVAPSKAGRGPTYNIHVNAGETKCVSLARAYEDSSYYYQMNTVHYYHGVALENYPVYFYS